MENQHIFSIDTNQVKQINQNNENPVPIYDSILSQFQIQNQKNKYCYSQSISVQIQNKPINKQKTKEILIKNYPFHEKSKTQKSNFQTQQFKNLTNSKEQNINSNKQESQKIYTQLKTVQWTSQQLKVYLISLLKARQYFPRPLRNQSQKLIQQNLYSNNFNFRRSREQFKKYHQKLLKRFKNNYDKVIQLISNKLRKLNSDKQNQQMQELMVFKPKLHIKSEYLKQIIKQYPELASQQQKQQTQSQNNQYKQKRKIKIHFLLSLNAKIMQQCNSKYFEQ